MNDILLQTIIDKLEDLEKSNTEFITKMDAVTDCTLELGNIHEKIQKVQMEIQGIPSQIYFPVDELNVQRKTMTALTEQLRQPVLHKDRHIHYLSKPILVCIALVAIIVGLSIWVGQLYEYIHTSEAFRLYQPAEIPVDSYKSDSRPNSLQWRKKSIKKMVH